MTIAALSLERQNCMFVKEVAKNGLTYNSTLIDIYNKYGILDFENIRSKLKKSPNPKKEIQNLLNRYQETAQNLTGFTLSAYNAVNAGEGNKYILESYISNFFKAWDQSDRFLPIDIFFDKFLQELLEGCKIAHFIPKLENTQELLASLKQGNPTDSLKYIIPELHSRLGEIEIKMSSKINKWKDGKGKIECAAFCELMYERDYFIKDSTRIKTLNNFALSRYGTDISIQLKAAKKKDRQSHQSLLQKHFL